MIVVFLIHRTTFKEQYFIKETQNGPNDGIDTYLELSGRSGWPFRKSSTPCPDSCSLGLVRVPSLFTFNLSHLLSHYYVVNLHPSLSPASYLFYIRQSCRLSPMIHVPVSSICRTTFKSNIHCDCGKLDVLRDSEFFEVCGLHLVVLSLNWQLY